MDNSVDHSHFVIENRSTVISSRLELVEKDEVVAFLQRRAGWLLREIFAFDTQRWGREEKEFQYIDIEEIRLKSLEKLVELILSLQKDTNDWFSTFRRKLDEYANHIRSTVISVRRYLEEEKIARESDIESYSKLRDEIITLSEQADDLRKEAEALRLELAA